MTDNSTLITKVAKAMLNGVYNRETAWDEFPEDHLSFERKATHALEFLASTGRLVPPDDDVIDAEVYGLRKNGDWLLSSSELDDLRIAWEAVKGYRVDGYARPHVNRLVEVVGRLFAATAPAECEFRCEEGITGVGVGVRCPACTAAIRDKEVAAPAEEETKAEYPHRGLGDLTVLGPEVFTNGDVINWRGENFVRQQGEGICSTKFDGDRVYHCALADGHYGDHTTAHGEHWQKRPASSPVVPAPTETGPWPSIEEVPTGLVVIGTNGERFAGCPCEPETHGYTNQFAPFVAAGPRYCPACKLNVPNAPYCTNCGGSTLADTGPWQRIEDVPEGVYRIQDKEGGTWRRHGSCEWQFLSHTGSGFWGSPVQIPRWCAPFVAAEEG